MRKIFRLPPLLAAVAFLTFLAACETEVPTAAPPSGEQPRSINQTPVSQEAKDVALAFAREQRAIDQDWQQFHEDLDRWRGGLQQCERNAAQAAFRGFASDFNDIPEQALGLSRPSSLRVVADKLIQASQEEAAALRRLRDRWQPDDTSLFGSVDQARAAATGIQKEVEDKIADLQEGTDGESVEDAQNFATAFEGVEADWNKFHDDYDSLRQKQADLTSEEISNQLAELAGQLAAIVALVRDLPSADATEGPAETLQDAADGEEKGLADLQNSVKGSADGAGGNSEAPAGSESPAGAPASDGSAAFDAFDQLVEDSEDVIRQVERELKDMVEEGPAKDVAAVQQFASEYDELLENWDQVHRGYDEWVRTEGGCDRAAVIERLREFGRQFADLANRARELPQDSFLRPMGNLMVEAADREEEALRVLRNNWRPFGGDVYRALDQERARAGRLRRQADVGVQELLERYELTLK